MTLALEQAGSLFTGWMRSCLSCLSAGEDSQSGRQVEGRVNHRRMVEDDSSSSTGVQREMQVCHTQPHLVPPMKLVVYDDLPSPDISHKRDSIPSWIMEGKNLASRASDRASVSMSWKRHTTAPLKISGPSDFRRVQSLHPQVPAKDYSVVHYQPLELSIHRSGNRLSDLPSFETFQLEEDRHRQPLAVPPRTLSPTGIRTQRCQSTEGAFAVARKPVGSGERRSVGNLENVIERPPPVRIASALIPHFSIVNPVETLLPEDFEPVPVHVRSDSEESDITFASQWPGHASIPEPPRQTLPRTPPARKDQEEGTDGEAIGEPSINDSPSTASSRTLPSQISSLRRPSYSPTDNRKTIASMPLSNRVSQWFLPSKHSLSKSVSLAGENGFDWERTRTLSGTTVGSTITTITGGAKARKPNASVSSTFTGFTTPRSSLRGPSPTMEKDLEAAGYHPTILKSKSQRFSDPPSHGYEHSRYPESTMGVAF
ncbi:uncharacterized protein N7459_004182 [Penicillium hispanicum]|uniref:uncharacterized protein n=1 Tax=Penicillium hispanicum TaxID=1080232 RepID=UPI00254162CD|nr:uncharacterized protein N7459_004182 [Penicillium hispanicum]KAJ5584382.1 hypothetical protein N7459_004182 [Penicillium hispanicum]